MPASICAASAASGTRVSPTYIGADVSKRTLDVVGLDAHHPAGAANKGSVASFANDADGVASLVRRMVKASPTLVVVESTGGYERQLVDGLLKAGVPVARADPLRVRRFAQSRGVLAKTDAIDAAILAQYAQRNADMLRPLAALSDTAVMLKELTTRRRQLVEQSVRTKNQREHVTTASVRESIDRSVKHLCEEIKAVEVEIQQLIDADEALKDRQSKLMAVSGVGPRVARVLVSELPELGLLDRKRIASLVGVAPFADQSGPRDNDRHIKGGRPTVRAALYMATLVATRHDPVIKAYYEHLKSNGKPKKVALVACMRKRLIHLNAILAGRAAPANRPDATPGGGAK